MHKLWTKAADNTLKIVTDTKGQWRYRRADKGSSACQICRQKRSESSRRQLHCNHMQAEEIQQICGAAQGVAVPDEGRKKYEAEGKRVSNQAAIQRDRLWNKLTRTGAEIEAEPYVKWLEQGKWELTQMPSLNVVIKLADVAEKGAKEETKDVEQIRRKKAKEKWKDKMEKGGSLAHQAVKIAQGAEKSLYSQLILAGRGWDHIRSEAGTRSFLSNGRRKSSALIGHSQVGSNPNESMDNTFHTCHIL